MENPNFVRMKDLGEKAIGLIVLIALLIANYGIFARFVLEISAAWTDELMRAIFIWLIFICSALAFNANSLISLEIVEDKLKEKPLAHQILKFVQGVFSVIFCTFCVYNGFLVVLKQFTSGETTPVMDIPLYAINFGFFIGALMLFFFSVKMLVVAATNLFARSDK